MASASISVRGDEIGHERGIGIERTAAAVSALTVGKASQFRLDVRAVRVRVIRHLARAADILFIRERGTIDHDRGKPQINGALAVFEIFAVVEVHAHVYRTCLCKREHDATYPFEGRDVLMNLGV